MKNVEEKVADEADEVALEKTIRLVRRLIEKIESQLDGTEAKGSVADYIKLLQLQKDLAEKQVRRIEVKWVDAD